MNEGCDDRKTIKDIVYFSGYGLFTFLPNNLVDQEASRCRKALDESLLITYEKLGCVLYLAAKWVLFLFCSSCLTFKFFSYYLKSKAHTRCFFLALETVKQLKIHTQQNDATCSAKIGVAWVEKILIESHKEGSGGLQKNK